MGKPFIERHSVANSLDFERIRALPRRVPQDPGLLVEKMTRLLRVESSRCAPPKPGDVLCPTCLSPLRLNKDQALALYELMTKAAPGEGVFCPMGVGTGKTLVSLLAATVTGARTPILMLPASLIGKTERERGELLNHWRVSTGTQIISYQMLGRERAVDRIDQIVPDLFVFDEAHRLKNLSAAVSRRVARFIEAHPEVRCVVLSGTIIKNSVKDFAHLLTWTHGEEGAPLPRLKGELFDWADALDEKVNPFKRPEPGALLKLAAPADINPEDALGTARRAFRRRLTETPGVVCSLHAERVNCSLYIDAKEFSVNAATEANFKRLRELAELPDGWALSESIEIWQHAKQLALGFHYVRVDARKYRERDRNQDLVEFIRGARPPEDWLRARRHWARFVRETIKDSDTLDSEKVVRTAVEASELEDVLWIVDPETNEEICLEDILATWKAVEPTFEPLTFAVWHDDSALKLAEAWLRKEKGIVWTEHVLFGRELAKRTGFPYYGQNGRDANGRAIDHPETPVGPCIASIAANGTGKNLQRRWSKNLITSWTGGADVLEQLIGRTHRSGQPADEVTVEVLIGCRENVTGWWSAIAEAQMAIDMVGQEQRLLFADVDMPSVDDLQARVGFRWGLAE